MPKPFHAGDHVLFNGSPRLLITYGRVVAFQKIGHSWTDPRPSAWYDLWAVKGRLRLIRRASPASRKRALSILNYRKPKPHAQA